MDVSGDLSLPGQWNWAITLQIYSKKFFAGAQSFQYTMVYNHIISEIWGMTPENMVVLINLHHVKYVENGVNSFRVWATLGSQQKCWTRRGALQKVEIETIFRCSP